MSHDQICSSSFLVFYYVLNKKKVYINLNSDYRDSLIVHAYTYSTEKNLLYFTYAKFST